MTAIIHGAIWTPIVRCDFRDLRARLKTPCDATPSRPSLQYAITTRAHVLFIRIAAADWSSQNAIRRSKYSQRFTASACTGNRGGPPGQETEKNPHHVSLDWVLVSIHRPYLLVSTLELKRCRH